jgi:CMP-N-acetylneuraminic acid synthetase
MSILITICARGGSKGIPGKNIKDLNGKPLIAYTIHCAEEFSRINKDADVILSTESTEIIEVAARYGLKSGYTRPQALASDTAGKIDVIKDVLIWREGIKNSRYDYILDLDVTSPLRNVHDLTEAMKIIENDDEAVNLFSVNPAARSPYFNMVEQKKNGYYYLVKATGKSIKTRQSAPKVYDLNASFYFYKREFFDSGLRGAVTRNSLIYVMPHICFDLDHPVDFEFLSYLMTSNKLDFKL